MSRPGIEDALLALPKLASEGESDATQVQRDLVTSLEVDTTQKVRAPSDEAASELPTEPKPLRRSSPSSGGDDDETSALLLLAHAAAAAEPTLQQCIKTNEDGQDRRREGKLREAEALFEFCTAKSCPGPLRAHCVDRLAEARGRIGKIVCVVTDRSSAPAPQVTLTMDSAPVAVREDDGSIHVDPGEHRFTISADGYRSITKTILVREGESHRESIVLPRAGEPDVVAARGLLGLPAEQERTLGWAVTGVGVVGLGVGTAFGLISQSNYDDERGARDVATVGIIAGAALVTAGIVGLRIRDEQL